MLAPIALLLCSALHLPLPLHPQIQAANPVSRALFNTAYRYKQAAMQRGDLSGGRLALCQRTVNSAQAKGAWKRIRSAVCSIWVSSLAAQ